MDSNVLTKPFDFKKVLKCEEELKKNPHLADDCVRIVNKSNKDVYNDIIKYGGSYDIAGGIDTLRKHVDEDKR